MTARLALLVAVILCGLAVVGSVAAEADRARAAAEAPAAEAPAPTDPVERGRYLVRIAGCNDCHTNGYLLGNGDVPEQVWLTGSALGFRGPWGTTYPPNLRLYMQGLSEDDWVTRAQNLVTRPPMPWFNLKRMNEQDLRDMYRYVRHLGSPGEAAPTAVGPDEEPETPYILMQPLMPARK